MTTVNTRMALPKKPHTSLGFEDGQNLANLQNTNFENSQPVREMALSAPDILMYSKLPLQQMDFTHLEEICIKRQKLLIKIEEE